MKTGRSILMLLACATLVCSCSLFKPKYGCPAGGVVTRFDGKDLGLEHAAVVAGNPAMHRWLLEIVSDRAR